MDKGRKRWLIRVAIVLVIGAAGLLWALGEHSRTLVIENHSEQTVIRLEVTIAGQLSTFRDVRTGAVVNAECKAKDGDRFVVAGQLADGTRIRSSGLIGESLHFLILPGGEVKFRPKSKKPF
ncbi:MAG TPA: hypothetical protein VN688_12580 [Gemmataceae bacterium]|nr:hypothetical protein [Gemmataceae bacterium]